MNLRIATWNINSLRLRSPLLKELVAALEPDVICLQETKVPDELFPAEAPAQLGFPHVLFRGMKGYNGVAILSRLPILLHDIAPDWCSKGDCRHIGVLLDSERGPIELHNFYVPAGGDIPDREQNVKYGHKLDFIAETRNWFAARTGLARGVLVGDLNIAPLEHDVWSHKQLLGVVSHTPPETEGLTAWQDTGFVDAVRHFVPPDQKLYTWWSVPQPRLACLGSREATGSCVGDGRSRRQADAPHRAEGRAGLAAGVGPRAGVRGAAGLTYQERNARSRAVFFD